MYTPRLHVLGFEDLGWVRDLCVRNCLLTECGLSVITPACHERMGVRILVTTWACQGACGDVGFSSQRHFGMFGDCKYKKGSPLRITHHRRHILTNPDAVSFVLDVHFGV